jgi:hypothetical protein
MMKWLFGVQNMLGVPIGSPPSGPITKRELSRFVAITTDELRDRVSSLDVDQLMTDLMTRPDLLPRRLLILRRAISYEGNLSFLMTIPGSLTDCQLREFFRAVEERVAQHLGEKKCEVVPFAGPFRTAASPSDREPDVVPVPDTKRGW